MGTKVLGKGIFGDDGLGKTSRPIGLDDVELELELVCVES